MVSRLTGYPSSRTRRSSGATRSRTSPASTRTACSRSARRSRSWTPPRSGSRATTSCSASTPGRHALKSALQELGFEVDGQALNTAFKRFKEIADRKKTVSAMDLEALVTDELRDELRSYTLEWFDVDVSNRRPPHARVSVRTPDGETVLGDFTGDGPVDAIFRAINAATKREARLREFRIDAVTGGQDALGEASVVLELAGQSASGQGVSTDIIDAAAQAYVRALSNAERKVHAVADAASEAELTPAP
jgi:2-isopropylmalate synthase